MTLDMTLVTFWHLSLSDTCHFLLTRSAISGTDDSRRRPSSRRRRWCAARTARLSSARRATPAATRARSAALAAWRSPRGSLGQPRQSATRGKVGRMCGSRRSIASGSVPRHHSILFHRFIHSSRPPSHSTTPAGHIHPSGTCQFAPPNSRPHRSALVRSSAGTSARRSRARPARWRRRRPRARRRSLGRSRSRRRGPRRRYLTEHPARGQARVQTHAHTVPRGG